MDILINTVMVICFITSGFWLLAEVRGTIFFKVVTKLIGLIGVVLPIVYFLKMLQII